MNRSMSHNICLTISVIVLITIRFDTFLENGNSKTLRCFENVKTLLLTTEAIQKYRRLKKFFVNRLVKWDRNLAKEKRHILLTVGN